MSSPRAASVAIESLGKRFPAGPAVLANVTLTAQPGDFVALIGPSGCGKTTLLRLLAGLMPPSAGAVTLDGIVPSEARNRLAFIFQEPTLLPWRTVRRNVELPLQLGRKSGKKEINRAEELLKLVGLEQASAQFPRQLSGGMKMRVSLARALALAPKLLLLDEPFGALDEITREHLNEELLAIRQELRWTAFFVTHSVAEAVFLSTRIVVMSANPGRVHTEIPVELPHPRTAETRRSHAYQDLVAQVSGVLREVEAAGGVA